MWQRPAFGQRVQTPARAVIAVAVFAPHHRGPGAVAKQQPHVGRRDFPLYFHRRQDGRKSTLGILRGAVFAEHGRDTREMVQGIAQHGQKTDSRGGIPGRSPAAERLRRFACGQHQLVERGRFRSFVHGGHAAKVAELGRGQCPGIEIIVAQSSREAIPGFPCTANRGEDHQSMPHIDDLQRTPQGVEGRTVKSFAPEEIPDQLPIAPAPHRVTERPRRLSRRTLSIERVQQGKQPGGAFSFRQGILVAPDAHIGIIGYPLGIQQASHIRLDLNGACDDPPLRVLCAAVNPKG